MMLINWQRRDRGLRDLDQRRAPPTVVVGDVENVHPREPEIVAVTLDEPFVVW